MTAVATGRPGRPAAATREDALALGTDRFLAGRARRCAGDRAGARPGAGDDAPVVRNARVLHRRGARRRSPRSDLSAIRRRTPGTRRAGAARVLRSIQPRAGRHRRAPCAARAGAGARPAHPDLERRDRAAADGRGDRAPDPRRDRRRARSPRRSLPSSLAYAIVRLAEAFLYNDAIIGHPGRHRAPERGRGGCCSA